MSRSMAVGVAAGVLGAALLATMASAGEPIPVQTLTWNRAADDVSVRPAQFYSYYGPRASFSFSYGVGYPSYGGYGYSAWYGGPYSYGYGYRPGYYYSFPGGYTYTPPAYFVAPYYAPSYGGYYGYYRW